MLNAIISTISVIIQINYSIEYYQPIDSSEEFKLMLAIKNNDFDSIENILSNNLVSLNDFYEGKTFVIWAAIYDKPEVINILVNFGADVSIKCEFGYTIEEHCIANKSTKALAEIIVLTS